MSDGCGNPETTRERVVDSLGRAVGEWSISVTPLSWKLGPQWRFSYRVRWAESSQRCSEAGAGDSDLGGIAAFPLGRCRQSEASALDPAAGNGALCARRIALPLRGHGLRGAE